MTTYLEKLKDPRWQKKRLEILERDDWKCRRCEDKESTLHVHHQIYHHDTKPWEYLNYELMTLCESCHEYERDGRPEIEKYLIKVLKQTGFLFDDIDNLTDFLSRVSNNYSPKEITFALRWITYNKTGIGVGKKIFKTLFNSLKKWREK